MSTKGQPVVSEVPPARRRSDYDWDAMALLAQLNKGKAVRAATNVTETRIKAVRKYRRPPFYTNEGHIVVSMRNSHLNKHDQRVGDVYFSWESNQKEN